MVGSLMVGGGGIFVEIRYPNTQTLSLHFPIKLVASTLSEQATCYQLAKCSFPLLATFVFPEMLF
jgi:hypothetical protein